jgi:iron complex outermembrane receptor protein
LFRHIGYQNFQAFFMFKFFISRQKLVVFAVLVFQMLGADFALCQEIVNIKAKVQDRATGLPIAGANISVKGSPSGAISDTLGMFSIRVSKDSNLIISSVGYKVLEVRATPNLNVIFLDATAENLGDVVVIGYGRVKKGDATGALATVKPDPLNRGMQLTPQDALVGRVAGVNVTPGTGAPGNEGIIRIRMGASLSASNDPLVVIDGVPISSGAPLSSINPNDIESYTVLKDASATAIYGSRASNGVLIITTKKGTGRKSRPQVSYAANFMLSKVTDYYNVLSSDEFRTVFKEKANAPPSFSLGTASTDWQKEIYRTAFGNEHNVSVNGNPGNLPYRFSVGYINQNGVIRENNYQRSNIGLGLSPKFFNKHLSVDFNFKGIWENERPVPTGVIGSAISFDPTRPINETYPNNRGLGYFMWTNAGTPIALAPSNPVADLMLTSRLNEEFRTLGNLALDYKVHGLEDLRFNLNLGYDIRNRTYSETVPDNAPSTFTGIRNDGRGRVFTEDNKNTNFIISAFTNYTKKIGTKHLIDAMAGYEWQRFWFSSKPQSLVRDVVDASVPDEDALYLVSFFGRLNYTFNQKILLTTTLRADASSRFAPENRWGYFPSAAVAYRLSEEKFIKNVKALSDLKFRISYGQTGQQDIGGYHPSLATYTTSTNVARYLFGTDWVTMNRPNGYDPNIQWETTTTYNAGLDFGFFKNRLFGSIDVFSRNTKDLLNRIAVPAGSNFTNVIETNIGSMKGHGVEIALGGSPIKNKNLEWIISGNFTYNNSTITKLNTIDNDNNFVKTGTISRRDFQIHKVGETPYTFFLLKQAYDEKGNPLEGKYIGKDGSITTNEQDANKFVTGKSSLAPYYYGLSTRLIYKAWDFGINGHGSFGNYVLNHQEAGQTLMSMFSSQGVSSNISEAGANRGFVQERFFSDIFLESGAFFRFDNITLGYSVGKLWNETSRLRLSLSAQNIILLTKYSGVDPEIFNGLDNNTYQRPRILTLSANVQF